MKTLVFGSLNIDYVYSVEHMVKEKETLASTELQVFSGGKGLNQAIAFAKAGANVALAGKIGMDGQFLLEECKKNGIDTSNISSVEGKSGHTIIQVDKNGQNAILLFGGTNQAQTREEIDRVFANFEADDYLILQNEINELPYIIDIAHEKGMKIVLNPSPYHKSLNRCDFSKIRYFIVNEVEAFQMTEKEKPDEIWEVVQKLYPKAGIVLTLGEGGAYYFDASNQYFQASIPTTVVDTTAAGDTFTGYFFTLLQEGVSPKEALLIAAKAASMTVSQKGAAGSIPFRSDMEE